MDAKKSAIQYREGQNILFESSFRAIPFNFIMAAVLCSSLFYNKLPQHIIITWLIAIVVVSCIRMLHCKLVINLKLLDTSPDLQLKIFLLLTLLMGLTWITIYFASLPHADKLQLYLILLVCGGMAAGSTGSLGVYLPAFYTYILAIFFPVIVYNYTLFDMNDFIFATMFVLFLLALTLIARSHQKLFTNVFFLTAQNAELMQKFELLSITDPLTGLYNRRHFNKILPDEYNRAKRNKHAFSLISIDVDNFKLINDNLGHPVGDLFLIYVANFLRSHFKRANDIIFRLGGDEFTVLLLNIGEDETKELCARMRTDFLKNPPFDVNPKGDMPREILAQVSLSTGIAYVPCDATASVTQIIAILDMILYKSKNEGKNQINYMKCL